MSDRRNSRIGDHGTYRQRSRSPRQPRSERQRHRSRSPHHKSRELTASRKSEPLPYNSRELSKRDYNAFKPVFALYLDIQKGKILEDMDEVEARGRWKSFYGKWNRGELSEGWYDPSTFQRAVDSTSSHEQSFTEQRRQETAKQQHQEPSAHHAKDDSSDSDGSIGPELPGQLSSKGRRAGPSIPNVDDLELKKEMDAEDAINRKDDIRYARKVDRKQQKEALDDLVPRAEAGTRERQLEKKKEVNEKMRSFREKSPGAAEVPDSELMGGGDDVDSFKKHKEVLERKKNERELRKEEFLRARQAERDERMQEYRAKEEGTMAMLKALAKQNFG